MEQQFILRLKGDLKNTINLKEATLEKLDDNKVQLVSNFIKYPGIIVKLPCIVESQKTLDKKQYYKICDISTMIVIYPHDNFDFEAERKILEISGLTPPLKYCKKRRFKKNMTNKVYIANEIEQKVNELLEKDKQATKVEIEGDTKEVGEEDIIDIVAEIENNLDTNEIANEEVLKQEVQVEDSPEIAELKKEIEQQENLVKNALNPILQERFKTKLDALKQKLEELSRNAK